MKIMNKTDCFLLYSKSVQVSIICQLSEDPNLKKNFNFPGLGTNRSLGKACRYGNPVCSMPQQKLAARNKFK